MHRREKDGLRRFLLELKEERLAVAEAAHSGASCDIGHIRELREVLKQIKDVGEHKFEACPESERYLNAADHTEEELAVMEDSVDLLDEASYLAAAGAGTGRHEARNRKNYTEVAVERRHLVYVQLDMGCR